MDEGAFDAIYEEKDDQLSTQEAADAAAAAAEAAAEQSSEDGESKLDTEGNPEGTEYGEDGEPTNLDDDGNLLVDEEEEPKTDENGNPEGTEYDDDGNPTNLDENGKITTSEEPETGSTISQFFEKKFGVKDGKIPFEDGTSVSLDEMTPDQQLEALEFYTDHLVGEASGKVTKAERTILEEIRKSGKSFNDLVATEVNERILKSSVEGKLGAVVDYTEMADEEVYRLFIKDTKPDMTDEELSAAIDAGKDHPAFDATVNHYRKHLEEVQTKTRADFEATQRKEAEAELNEDRETIIDAVRNIDSVSGWPVNDDVKNELLGELVEVDAEGNSGFMKEVFGDPSKMFQAAWYMKYGEAYFTELNNYWQNEVKKVAKGDTTKPKGGSFAKPGAKPKPGKSVNKSDSRKAKPKKNQSGKTMEDIYDN